MSVAVPEGLGATPDLTGTCWRDDMFLQFYGLHPGNALDYFSLSIFYDRNCNNEVAKLRGLAIPAQLPSLAPGVEYELAVQDCQPPHLFLIRKQYRASPGQAVALAYYYVLDGTIYQAPTLHAALSGRMLRCMYNLRGAFQDIQQDLDPLAKGAELREESALERELAAGRAPPKQVSHQEKEHISKVAAILTPVVNKHRMPEPKAALAAAAAAGTGGAPNQQPGACSACGGHHGGGGGRGEEVAGF